MDGLDGNAIAGALHAVFGGEMTTAWATCASCGAVGRVGELQVYLRAPGTVVRCRDCCRIVMTLVEIRAITCVDLRGLAALGPASG
jgi:hypothetical protein